VAYVVTLRLYHPGDCVESHQEATLIYLRCRRAGVSICSTIDCLIASTAIENKLVLVHYDGDCGHMREVCPVLNPA
jgi:predicted nucleic acid-binding protein